MQCSFLFSFWVSEDGEDAGRGGREGAGGGGTVRRGSRLRFSRAGVSGGSRAAPTVAAITGCCISCWHWQSAKRYEIGHCCPKPIGQYKFAGLHFALSEDHRCRALNISIRSSGGSLVVTPDCETAVPGSNPAISAAYSGLLVLRWFAIWDGTSL